MGAFKILQRAGMIMAFKSRAWRVAPFIFLVVTLEQLAGLSIGINLFTYAFNEEHFSLASSANIATNYMGTVFLVTLLGGIISDVWWTRFRTILLAGLVEILGLLLVALTASEGSLRPPKCGPLNPSCTGPSISQKAIFFSGIYLFALGSGGLKSNLATMGADQFNDQDAEEKEELGTYFNFYYFHFCLGGLGAITGLVYIQENISFKVGYLVALGLVVLTVVVFVSGYSLYKHNQHAGTSSPLASIAQVFVAAIRNRNRKPAVMPLEVLHEDLEQSKSYRIEHTDQFKFLDRAAMDHRSDSESPLTKSPWKLCTVTQVEEVKILLRILPIFACTIVLNCLGAQVQTVSQQQGRTMDRTLVGNVKIPPASLSAIPLAFTIAMLPVYEKVFVPLVRRVTKRENGLTYLQRISVGLLLAIVGMVVAVAVEKRRLHVARKFNLLDQPAATIPMKMYWIMIQYAILGIAELFTFVGLIEFFYRESPERLRSMSTSLSFVSLSLGYFLSSALVSVVKRVTTRNGELGWLPDNINRGKLTNFYWLLAILSAANFAIYLLCAHWYRYRTFPAANNVDYTNGTDCEKRLESGTKLSTTTDEENVKNAPGVEKLKDGA